MQIRQAYRNLLTKTHPDKGGDAEQFDRIKAAYEVLADPEKVTVLSGLDTYKLVRGLISAKKLSCRSKSTTGPAKFICLWRSSSGELLAMVLVCTNGHPRTHSASVDILILQATSETRVLLHKQHTQPYQSKSLCGSLQ